MPRRFDEIISGYHEEHATLAARKTARDWWCGVVLHTTSARAVEPEPARLCQGVGVVVAPRRILPVSLGRIQVAHGTKEGMLR